MGGGGSPQHGVSQELRAVHQDMPPPGGYPSVLFAKAQKNRGPEGWVIWLGAMAVVAVGFYRVGQTNLERNAAKREKREARMNIVPYLQAEEDRRFCTGEAACDAEEARVMSGVKGWTVGENLYSNGSWEPPTRTDHPRNTGVSG
jgi:NADH dehydrogenase (ubiquinone) 1 alpha subcomplex subunit 13